MSAYETWKNANPLHAAAQLNDTAAMEAALATNPSSINSIDNEKWTPLHYACFEGHLDAIQFLVTNGADIKIGNHFGSTPLHLTIGTGNIAATGALMDVVDSIDVLQIKNEDKQIPRQMLMIADSGQKEIRALLDAKEAALANQTK